MAGVKSVFASIQYLESVDISSVDHNCGICGGIARLVYCDTAGEILKIDTTRQSGVTTLALLQGYNPIEVTKVYKTGSTITGNVQLCSWD